MAGRTEKEIPGADECEGAGDGEEEVEGSCKLQAASGKLNAIAANPYNCKMKNFLRAAFKITLFQISVILISGAIKYWMVSTGISSQLQTPFLITAGCAFFILLLALGIGGIIENKGQSFESWVQEHSKSRKHAAIGNFVKWGQIIPLALGYLLFIYFIAPTSFALFLTLLAGIVIGNITSYLSGKYSSVAEDTVEQHTI
jgi:hypothetical protein